MYRYPFGYDNDEFIQKLSVFIADDLENNEYLNLNKNCNSYHVDLVNDSIQFVDRPVFYETEKEQKRKYVMLNNLYKVDDSNLNI